MYSVSFSTLTYCCLQFSLENKLVFSSYTKHLLNTKWCTFHVSNLLRDFRELGRPPVGARFSAPVQTGPGVHPVSYTMGTGSFPGVKRPGRGVEHPPHLAPRLKNE